MSQGRANPILDITELGQGGPHPSHLTFVHSAAENLQVQKAEAGWGMSYLPSVSHSWGSTPSPASGTGGLGCGGTLCEHP